MPENILSTSTIKLYGRLFDGLQVSSASTPPNQAMNMNKGTGTNELNEQLGKANARFSRIYCFSYEGGLYSLSKPVIILVHSDGTPASAFEDVVTDLEPPGDFRVWAYDKEDMSVVCQIYSGTLNDLLLLGQGSGFSAPGQMNAGQMNAGQMNAGQMAISCRGGRF